MKLPLLLATVFVASAYAHPGGLDSKGGHNDRKNGGYHYHRGGPSAAPATPKPVTAPTAKQSALSQPGAGTTAPQPATTDTLLVAIQELREQVQQLQIRVARMEKQAAVSPLPVHLTSWRRIRQGTTQAEVRALLGEPQQIDWPFWRYSNGGKVMFLDGAEIPVVYQWTEPTVTGN